MQNQNVLCVLFALLFNLNNLYSQQFPLSNLDNDIKTAMEDYNVPGMAVGIIKNDTIIFQRGFGVKSVIDNEPIDINTIFGIGSTTKTFTSGLAAVLVNEGILNWDDKVIQHLPEFELYDPYITKEVTVSDLLSHRVGVEAANILWLGSNFNREEIISKTKYLKPEYGFREKYYYNNIMILTAGYLMGKITGKTWDILVKEKILEPLGMKSSCTSINDLEMYENIATPHIYENNKLVPIPWGNIDNIGPAGSINSNLVDMLKWVKLHLKNGKFDSVTLWNDKIQRKMQTPHSIISHSTKGSTHFRTYGLGWQIWDFRGKLIVWHNGMCDGFFSLIQMLPEEKLGIVILQNVFHPKFAIPLMLRITDAYLDVPEEKWWKLGKPGSPDEDEPQTEFTDYDESNLTLPLSKYTGTFVNEMLGSITVIEKDKKLHLNFEAYPNAVLRQKSKDIFIAEFNKNIPFMFSRYVNGEPIEVEFRIDENKIKEVEVSRFGIFK